MAHMWLFSRLLRLSNALAKVKCCIPTKDNAMIPTLSLRTFAGLERFRRDLGTMRQLQP